MYHMYHVSTDEVTQQLYSINKLIKSHGLYIFDKEKFRKNRILVFTLDI